MRRPRLGASGVGLAAALALVLTGCGGPRKQPERILGWDRPSAAAAPVESRVPKPTPATLAVVKAVTAGNGVAPGNGGTAAGSGTSSAAALAATSAAAASAQAPGTQAASASAPQPAAPTAAPAAAPAATVAPAAYAPTRSLGPAPSSLPSVLYFDIDHYRVKPADHALLQQHAAALKAHPERVLLVRGHADGQGPVEYNRALADKRAETVARLLASMGVEPRQIRHEAAAPNGGGAAAAKPQREDRRVELVYVEMGAVAGR